MMTKGAVRKTSRFSALLLLIPFMIAFGVAPSQAAQLNQPSNVRANIVSGQPTSISVNFAFVTGSVASYTVFIYDSDDYLNPVVTQTNYIRRSAITGFTANRTYKAKVQAIAAAPDTDSLPSEFSPALTLGTTAPGLPTITVQPTAQSSTYASTATFSVTATSPDSGTLGYQWQVSTNSGGSWSNVSTGTGGTTNSYTTASLEMAANDYRYRVNVTNTRSGTTSSAVTSNSVALTVAKANQAPLSPPVLSATTATYNGSAYTQALTVSTGGGGSGSGTLSITGVENGSATGCSFSAGTLTASTSGTCALTITKAEDADYNAVSTTATFTFRDRSSDSNLGSLTVTPGTTTPVLFSSATTSYSVSISSTVQTLTVTATLSNQDATMTLNGSALSPNTPTTVAVDETSNAQVITVRVTAEDLTTKDYSISVKRVVIDKTSEALAPNVAPTPSASPVKSTTQRIKTPSVSVLPRINASGGLSVTSGPVGQTVIINGTGFNSLLSVKMNGSRITPSSTSSTSITLTIPTGARTGTFVVTTSKGSVSTPRFTVTTGS